MTRSKELYQEMREAELNTRDYSPSLAEIEFDHNARYCGGCNTNWSGLATGHGEGDEEYSFCPTCLTDEHLQDGRPGETYRFSPITGQTINNRSGRPRHFNPPPPPEIPAATNIFDQGSYFATKNSMERQENRAISAYISAFESQGKESGEKAYFDELKKQKKSNG